jgi:hypothetical protein
MSFESELATEKLKCHKPPGSVQIPAELIKAGGRAIGCDSHILIVCIWGEEKLLEGWKESIIVTLYNKGDQIHFNYSGITLLQTTYKNFI